MRGEPVLGEDGIPLAHHAIALHLGENGCGSDRRRDRIAMDDGSLRQLAVQTHRIHQQVVGRRRKLHHGLAHGDAGCLIDVDLVNPRRIHGGNCPGNRVFADSLCQHFPALGQEQFGIAQSPHAICRIENHRARDHRTKERTAPNFVHPGNHDRAGRPGAFFVAQSAVQLFQQAQLGR